MKAIDIPVLGKGMVLPPAEPEASHLFAVDRVYVDEECPTCGGRTYGETLQEFVDGCPECGDEEGNYSGSVSVPHKVREVLPIVKLYNSAVTMRGQRHVGVSGFGLTVLVDADGQVVTLLDCLRDAKPGGVLLVLGERAS